MGSWLYDYWRAVAEQDEEALRRYFHPGARIRWHCSNEAFSVAEFLRANCEYPGDWQGQVERIEDFGDTVITAVRVWTAGASFHVASFFRMRDGKIAELDEYWGDDGPAPQWRQEKHIGRKIK